MSCPLGQPPGGHLFMGGHMPRPANMQAGLFDFDGVCADTEPLGLQLDSEVYAYYGIEPTDEERHALVGTTGEETIPWLFRRHGMEVTAREFWSHRRPNDLIYREMPLQLIPGIPERWRTRLNADFISFRSRDTE